MKKIIIIISLLLIVKVADAGPCRVVYKPDKSVVIIHPAPKSKKADETEQQWLDRVYAEAMEGVLSGLEFEDIDYSELPSREFRGAWEKEKGKEFKINQTKKKKFQDKKTVSKRITKDFRQQAIEDLKTEGKIDAEYSEE